MDPGKPWWANDSMDDIMANVVLNPGWLFSYAVLSGFAVVFSLSLMNTHAIPWFLRNKAKKTLSRLGR